MYPGNKKKNVLKHNFLSKFLNKIDSVSCTTLKFVIVIRRSIILPVDPASSFLLSPLVAFPKQNIIACNTLGYKVPVW